MIKQNVNKILSELPGEVQLVAAAKARKPEEILEAIESGIKIVGERLFIGSLLKKELVLNKPDFALNVMNFQ